MTGAPSRALPQPAGWRRIPPWLERGGDTPRAMARRGALGLRGAQGRGNG
jgi:hypothetical protein